MTRATTLLLGAVMVVAVAFFLATAPAAPPAPPDGARDIANGETVFHIAGCASCHAAPGAEGAAKLILSGGQRFPTDFGVFVAPNISSHPDAGIGGWSEAAFLNAVLNGVSPDGRHYYPAFPYASYARMSVKDAADLWAFFQTLPASETPSAPSEVGFPFNIRRGLGLWKHLNVSASPIAEVDASDPLLVRGRYLVEGPGHCGECHTPRGLGGGLQTGAWLTGAPSADGPGRIPALAGSEADVQDWSDADIAEYLRSGFTPDYDTAGGSMVDVIANTAQLSDHDRLAIAAYLKSL